MESVSTSYGGMERKEMNYQPDTATYIMEGWKGYDYHLDILPKGQAQRIQITQAGDQKQLLLTLHEAEQLMESLEHYFNKEVK